MFEKVVRKTLFSTRSKAPCCEGISMNFPHSSYIRLQSSWKDPKSASTKAAFSNGTFFCDNDTIKEKKWPSVYEEARDMAMAAYVSYPMSFLIRQAKAGNLKNSEKVLKRFQLIRDGDISSGPLSPAELLEIVNDNRSLIEREYCAGEDLECTHGWYSALNRWNVMEQSRGFPGSLSLLEFDDHNEAHRLVYGLVINHLQRRVTIVFRGTYADGTDDWKRNLQADQVEVPVPAVFSQKIGHSNSERKSFPSRMKIYRGLYEYLFDNPEKGPRFEKERYDEITDLLFDCLRDNPNYDIYVTGHSLGGALAELFAVYLSTNTLFGSLSVPSSRPDDLDDSEIQPHVGTVTCVCIGSAITGDRHFASVVSYLEQISKLRYLRVANEDDPVCYFPPTHRYRISGMQLRLNRHNGSVLWHPKTNTNFVPMEKLGYNIYSGGGQVQSETKKAYHINSLSDSDMARGANSWSNFMRALRYSIQRQTDLFKDHTVPSYLKRLEREREYLSSITVDRSHLETKLFVI